MPLTNERASILAVFSKNDRSRFQQEFSVKSDTFANPRSRFRPVLCSLWLCSLWLWTESVVFAQTNVRIERAYRDYLNRIEELITDLDEIRQQAVPLQATEMIGQIDEVIAILKGENSVTGKLPREIQGEIRFDLPAEHRELTVRQRAIRKKGANDLYLLARRVMKEAPTFSYELLQLVLQVDSDHSSARTLRGYVRQGDFWMTPFERDQIRSGKVEHPIFGWMPQNHVEKYEQGERFYLGNWISAEKEAEIRRDFQHAWEIQTENFRIKTNVSLEKGVELAQKLEIFHDYFKQTFSPFYNSPEQIQQLFEGVGSRGKNLSQLYEVHFFRNKDEYVRRLQKRVPQISLTNGLYQLEDRISYFYDDPERNLEATLFHEATHQLMYESHLKQRDVGREAHFWIIEGIACYMESFRIQESASGFKYEVGDPRFIRFYWARHRLLKEDYQPSLAIFTRLSMEAFQTGTAEELQRRYSQAAGMSHFFMHAEQGKFRLALMQHLAELYHSNPRIQQQTRGLDQLTGIEYSALDQMYRQYISDQQTAVGNDLVWE